MNSDRYEDRLRCDIVRRGRAKSLSLHQFRTDELDTSMFAEFMNRQDVRMIQSRGGPRLQTEAPQLPLNRSLHARGETSVRRAAAGACRARQIEKEMTKNDDVTHSSAAKMVQDAI